MTLHHVSINVEQSRTTRRVAVQYMKLMLTVPIIKMISTSVQSEKARNVHSFESKLHISSAFTDTTRFWQVDSIFKAHTSSSETGTLCSSLAVHADFPVFLIWPLLVFVEGARTRFHAHSCCRCGVAACAITTPSDSICNVSTTWIPLRTIADTPSAIDV